MTEVHVIDRGPNIVWCLQGNSIDRADTAGCNGRGWKADASYTINRVDRHAVAYSFDSLASNSMKSKNPHSGCRIVDVSKTLDASGSDPSKNQGGIAILQKVFDARGNGDRKTVCTPGNVLNQVKRESSAKETAINDEANDDISSISASSMSTCSADTRSTSFTGCPCI